MDAALRAKPLDIKEQQCEKQIREPQEAYGEAILQMPILKKYQNLVADDDK
jgi:hypothetical protein